MRPGIILVMKYIIFDFNGTVVDDIGISLNAINHTVKKYLNRKEVSLEEYRDVFTFPVKKYYERVGFDFNILSWEEVGQTWMDYYLKHQYDAPLHEGVKELLIKAKQKGYTNVVLSASKLDQLKKQLKDLGVYDYFDIVLGIDNIYATSKLPLALDFIKDKNPTDCLFIGDSGHDKEVADAMGVRCLLIAKGHESKERLLKLTDEVYDDIREVQI